MFLASWAVGSVLAAVSLVTDFPTWEPCYYRASGFPGWLRGVNAAPMAGGRIRGD